MGYAAARQLYSWQEFNEWARGVMARTKKHPGVRAIREWWIANAERVWPHSAKRPTVQLAERHAKGLRSKEHIRRYFRKYRAKRRQQDAGNKGRKKQPQEADDGGSTDDSSEVAVDEDCQTCESDGSDDEQREAAETLITALHNRPQRKRLAPFRFRSNTSMSGGHNDSCGSESLVDETDDSDESGEYISSDVGIVSHDQLPRTCSENEPRRQRQRSSVGHGDCDKVLGTAEPSRSPEKFHEPNSDLLGTNGSLPQGHEPQNKVFIQASSAPNESSVVAAQGSHVHLLASASEHPPLLPLGIQPLRSVLLEAMDAPKLPQESVFQSTLCRTDMEARDVAGASGQSLLFHNLDTPTPGHAKAKPAERLHSRCTPTFAAAAAAVDSTPSSHLRRLISAQLLNTHCANMFGYDLALNGNLQGFAIQQDANVGNGEFLANGTKLSSTEPRTNLEKEADAQLGRTYKRAASDNFDPQCRKKPAGRSIDMDRKVEDVKGTGAASAPIVWSKVQTPQHVDCREAKQTNNSSWAGHERSDVFPVPKLADDNVAPLQPWCKHRDGNGSPCELSNPAVGDPSTVLRLGRMMGSDFGVSQGPELALWRMPQNGRDADAYTERANQLGASTAVADGSSSMRVGSGTNCERGGGGSLDVCGHQPGLRLPTGTAVLAHMKKDVEESDGGASWVPIDDASGSGYDSGYDGGYSSGAAFPGAEPWPGLPYPPGVLPPTLGLQHILLPYVPPALRQHQGWLSSMPSNGGICWYAPPLSVGTSCLPWQLLDTRREMLVNASESGTHFDQDAQYWDRALAVANAATAAARNSPGQGGTGDDR